MIFLIKRDEPKRIKINKFNINRVMVLSENLDRGDIISRAVSLFLFILKHCEDGYSLYFLPPQKSKKPGFLFVLSSHMYRAANDFGAQNDNLEIYSTNLSSKAMNSKQLKTAKNYLMSQLNLTEISDELFVNLALAVHRKCLEFLKKLNYGAYMIPEKNSGKRIFAINNC